MSDTEDRLINAREARRLAGNITSMTLWRWRRAEIVPAPIQIRNRNYWRRSEYLRALEAASRRAGDASGNASER
jgi:hypothetical protein